METVLYTVQSGDTLYKIAQRFDTTVNMIARYNGIVDPDYIEAGRILRIPVSEIPAMQKAKAMPYREYIVKKGDTLAAIAAKSGVGLQRIAAFNGILDPDVIQEGQVLRIPFPLPKDGEQETVIQKGDTLDAIAKQSGVTAQQIAQRNNIADADRITAGESILLPADKNTSQEKLEYVVQEGDTLWRIAQQYGVSVAYLVNRNRLCQPDRLEVGQIILIRR